MRHRCPICSKAVKASAGKEDRKSEFYPFCSPRCRLIDLGSWLEGKYSIGSESERGDSADEATGGGNKI